MCRSKSLPEPKKLSTWLEERAVMAAHIREHAKGHSSLEILEAGCGTTWGLDLTGLKYRLTGIDLDQAALEVRLNLHNDLDEAICGDLRTVSIKDESYDVIFNSYVLEHISGAEQVLINFSKWLKLNGLLILVIPNRDSVWGFITRLTPFWFHVIISKYIMGKKDAGRPGHAPYPTFYDKVVSRRGIYQFCTAHGLFVKEEYSVGHGRRNQKWFVFVVTRVFVYLAYVLSLGQLSAKHANSIFVIQKGLSAHP